MSELNEYTIYRTKSATLVTVVKAESPKDAQIRAEQNNDWNQEDSDTIDEVYDENEKVLHVVNDVITEGAES